MNVTRWMAVVVTTVLVWTLSVVIAAEADAATKVTKTVCKTKTLKVRKAASTRSKAVGSLSAGTVVTGSRSGSWVRLSSGPFAGRYVSNSYLCAVSPSASAGSAASAYAPGTSVHYSQSQQVLVATQTGGSTGSFHGTWARYQWTGSQWQQVGDQNTDVRFGTNGVQDGATRVMGSGTTPTGTYPLPLAFGEGNPGTAMPYNTITACSWWIDVDALRMGRPDLFNRWFEDCAHTYPDAEDLSALRNKGLYRQAVVIGHNYADPRKTSGPGSSSAIFLHYTPPGGRTAGCIGLTSFTELTNTVRWLNPASKPVIVIR